MNPMLKNILAVIAGLIIGGVVNIFFVNLGPTVIPPPEGADVTTMEGLAATMHLFEPKHFLFPFLAHALGTLVGAMVAAAIAANYKQAFAIVIGGFFLVGGIMMVMDLPSPLWFTVTDLALAYIPMGWLGYKIYAKVTRVSA